MNNKLETKCLDIIKSASAIGDVQNIFQKAIQVLKFSPLSEEQQKSFLELSQGLKLEGAQRSGQ